MRISDVFDDILYAWRVILTLIFLIPIGLTLIVATPLWIVPYLIYKKRKKEKR